MSKFYKLYAEHIKFSDEPNVEAEHWLGTYTYLKDARQGVKYYRKAYGESVRGFHIRECDRETGEWRILSRHRGHPDAAMAT